MAMTVVLIVVGSVASAIGGGYVCMHVADAIVNIFDVSFNEDGSCNEAEDEEELC